MNEENDLMVVLEMPKNELAKMCIENNPLTAKIVILSEHRADDSPDVRHKLIEISEAKKAASKAYADGMKIVKKLENELIEIRKSC